MNCFYLGRINMQMLANACLMPAQNGDSWGNKNNIHSFIYWLFCLLFVVLFFSVYSQARAETTPKQVLTQEEVMRLIVTGDKEKILQYIDQQSIETLNQSFELSYGRGNISLLSLMVEMKAPELIKKLLKKGVNPDGLKLSYKSPLEMAMETAQWDIVELLLNGGANPSRLVVSRGFSHPVPLFYKVLDENNSQTWPFLDIAVKFSPSLDYTEEMKNEKDHPQLGYLALALRNKPVTPEVIRYLLSKGEDPEKKSHRSYGSLTPYQFLLDAGYRRGTTDKEGLAKRQKTLKVLLDHGVKPFPKNSRRTCYDPLYIVRTNVDLLKTFIDKGLDPNKVSCYHKTHLGVAVEIADSKMIETLLKAGGKLDSKLITEIISQRESKPLISWLQNNHMERFEQCDPTECEAYLRAFIVRRTYDNDDYSLLIDPLISGLSGQSKALDKSLKMAITYKNDLDMADRLLKSGATLSDAPHTYWGRGLSPAMMSWLIKQKISPFSKEKPIDELLNLGRIPAVQLSSLLQLLDDPKATQSLLQKWLIVTLNELNNGTSVDYIELDQRMALAEKNSVNVNKLKTKEGALFIPILINQLIKKQDSHDGDVKLIWLMAKGVQATEENKSHYIDNNYLRGLLDRNGSKTIDLAPQSPSETKALMALIEDNMNHPSEIINLLLSIGRLPVNKEVGLITLAEFENGKINSYVYACHYASYRAVWAWLQQNIDEDNKENLLSLYQVCSAVDLSVSEDEKSVNKEMRKDWFEMNFASTNFELLAIQATDKKDASENPSQIASQNKHDDTKVKKLETILFAQFKKLDFKTIDSTKETLQELKQLGWKAPDNILETFVKGFPDYYQLRDYSQHIVLLTQMGADPTKPIFGTAYNFMEHLPVGDDDGQQLYNTLYSDLSFTKKVGLWDSFMIRLTATSSNTRKLRKKGLIAPLIIGLFFVLAELLVFISLITYLIKTKKNPISKALLPAWQVQTVFLASLVLLIIAVVNVIGIELVSQTSVYEFSSRYRFTRGANSFIEPLVSWNLWFKSTLVLLIIQFLMLIFLFKTTFINKKHPAVTFFIGLILFAVTMILPVMVGMLSHFHDDISFPLLPL